MLVCGGLTLSECQVPTKTSLSLSSSAGLERDNVMKGSWVRIRTETSLSNCCHGENRLYLGKLI